MSALTIHPKLEDTNLSAGDIRMGRATERQMVHAKRFTDSELAAEYQFSRLSSRVRFARTENYPGDIALYDYYERGLEQEWTLERFATLPHYDEQP